jgi:dUTP pyrophosphatase
MRLLIKTDNKNYTEKFRIEGDSGYDLYFPENVLIEPRTTKKIDLKVQVELLGDFLEPRSILLLPRSSICKTPLRLANSIGLIDSGYRGNIIVYVDNISDSPFLIEKDTRLFQLATPNLDFFDVKIVQILSNSERGNRCFGSTDILMNSI